MSLPPELLSRLERALADDVTPGGVIAVAPRDQATIIHAFGARARDGRPTEPDVRYDLASLTKVVATLPAILHLLTSRSILLDDTVGRFFPAAGWFQRPSLADVTIRMLLTHTSGLAAWTPLYAHVASRSQALAHVLNDPVRPPGDVLYSDLGYMLLGAIVERVTGDRLDHFVHREVFTPLAMSETQFGPLRDVPSAPTENCGWRNRWLEGEVHDENAVVWDGVAGHAGAFGTARDVARYARAWLELDERMAAGPWLAEATREHAISHEGGRRGLGWQLGGPGSVGGADAPHGSYGHTGFTGTSLWIEPDLGVATVLLTNRVHPRRGSADGIQALRRHVHSLVRTLFGKENR